MHKAYWKLVIESAVMNDNLIVVLDKSKEHEVVPARKILKSMPGNKNYLKIENGKKTKASTAERDEKNSKIF